MRKENKLRNKILKAATLGCAAVMMFSTVAWAGTSYSGYNTTVGRFNGSGYSGYQTKSIAGANGYIKSTKVGGDYVVDVRMNSSAGNGAWLRNVGDNTSDYVPGKSTQLNGTSVRLEFSNDITTPVNTQVEGTWKSN